MDKTRHQEHSGLKLALIFCIFSKHLPHFAAAVMHRTDYQQALSITSSSKLYNIFVTAFTKYYSCNDRFIHRLEDREKIHWQKCWQPFTPVIFHVSASWMWGFAAYLVAVRQEGCQDSDRSSRLCLYVSHHRIFLRQPPDNFQPCLCW